MQENIKVRKFIFQLLQLPVVPKAILRESLFNTINFEIIDKNFVEVFAGSGLVAIEAVSRGAKKAWCIEKHHRYFMRF